jgi:hypothetical protein
MDDAFQDNEPTTQPELTIKVNKPELDLLQLIRSKEFEFIKVKVPDGKINLMECSKCITGSTRIADLLNEDRYQDVEIKQTNGKISFIRKTKKIKY